MEDIELGLLSEETTAELNPNGEIPTPLLSLVWSIALPYVSKVEDLKNIRLVCHLWRDVTINHWRSTSVLRLLWRKDCKAYCHACHISIKQVDYDYRNTMDLPTYLELVQNSGLAGDWCPYQLSKKPFAHYRIGYCNLIHGVNGDNDILERFWDLCGPNMEFLYLDHCSVPESRFGQGFRRILSEKCGKLKELWVHVIPSRMEQESGMSLSEEDRREQAQDTGAGDHVPLLGLTVMNLSICKKRRYTVRGNHSNQFSPLGVEWMVLLRQAPNLKYLTVNSDREGYRAVGALRFPSCNGQVLQLAKLTYLVKMKYPSFSSNDIPDWREYLEVNTAPLPTVDIEGERTKRNLSYFRETAIGLLRYVLGSACNCYNITMAVYVLMIFLSILLVGVLLLNYKFLHGRL